MGLYPQNESVRCPKGLDYTLVSEHEHVAARCFAKSLQGSMTQKLPARLELHLERSSIEHDLFFLLKKFHFDIPPQRREETRTRGEARGKFPS